jgi:N-acetylglucosaminyl-diphospho-decaprenol L-rhamnosyltransferase
VIDGRPLVSIIILSYRRPTMLGRALATAVAQDWPHTEVIVVDNKSEESDSIAAVTASYPAARLLRNQENLGFTGGMNAGIAAAGGDYIYLTEDDIEMDTGCISALVSYLQRHPGAGLAGAMMLNHDDGTIRCAGGHVDLGRTFSMKIIGAGESPKAIASVEPYPVSYLPGASMMASRDQFTELGGFSGDFFMYLEDVELCCRVLQRGLDVAVVPEARVAHHRPGDSPSPRLEFGKIRNLATLYFVHAPLRVIPEFVLRYGLIGSIRAIGRGPRAAFTHMSAWGSALLRAPRLLARRLRTQTSRVKSRTPR